MQLDYKILWIENDTDFVEEKSQEFKSHFYNKGFNLIISPIEEVTDSALAGDIENLNEFAMLLIDFNLESDKGTGDKIIKAIRANKTFTNIVFYSSTPDLLEEEINEKENGRLQGVHIFDRKQIEESDDILELFDFFLEKDLNENTMRGIVMSEIAKFDATIWNLFENQQIISADECKKQLSRKVKSSRIKAYNSIKKLNDLDMWNLIKKDQTTILGSTHRFETFHSKILKGQESCKKEYDYLIQNYNACLNKRNQLAHHIDVEMSKEEQLNLRKEILEFRKIFTGLNDKICSQQKVKN